MLTLNKLQEIINKHDPVGLYPGAWTPDNEYDIEAKEILLYNSQNNSVDFYDFVKKGKQNGFDMASGTNGQALKREKLEELLSELTYLRFNISAGEPEAYAKIMGTNEKNFYKVIDTMKECVKIKKENGFLNSFGFLLYF